MLEIWALFSQSSGDNPHRQRMDAEQASEHRLRVGLQSYLVESRPSCMPKTNPVLTNNGLWLKPCGNKRPAVHRLDEPTLKAELVSLLFFCYNTSNEKIFNQSARISDLFVYLFIALEYAVYFQ